ncbi:hypothetical protein JST97_21155 [bacterium]|nr:hypothetical protein [bacterium]
MRGWKVNLSVDLAEAAVGKTRGPALELVGCGWARGKRSDLHVYLVEELPEGWTDDHEQALAEKLNDNFGGSWVLVQGSRLMPRWADLTHGEKRLLRRREGFRELEEWPER